MKTILQSIFCLLTLSPCLLSAQSFSIAVTPELQSVSVGDTATYSVIITPLNGFNATVFLSVAPTSFYGTIALSATSPNPPYENISLRVIPSIRDTGTKSISIIGKNSGVEVSTPCTITIRKNIQWTTLNYPVSIWSEVPSSTKIDNRGDVCVVAADDSGEEDSIKVYHYRNQRWERDKNIYGSFVSHRDHVAMQLAYDKSGVHWFSSMQGVVRYDWNFVTIFNSSNSGLTSNTVQAIEIDRNGLPICSITDNSDLSLARYNGTIWKSNKLKRPTVATNVTWGSNLCVDSSNNIWIPTLRGGIVRIQDTIQENFHTKGTSPIWSNDVSQIICGKNGVIWCLYPSAPSSIALSTFDGTSWKNITSPTTSKLFTFLLDSDTTVWLSSAEGLHWYNGTSWTTYNKSNSPLPTGSSTILQDKYSNMWILIDDLFYIFNPNGLVGIPLKASIVHEQPETTDPTTISPNPSSTTITISGTDNISAVKIVNSLGKEVVESRMITGGSGSISVDVSELASGVYFVQLRTPTGMISKPIIIMH